MRLFDFKEGLVKLASKYRSGTEPVYLVNAENNEVFEPTGDFKRIDGKNVALIKPVE
ncbi:hypothetical protein HWC02_gp060 [Gordonia phage Sombrero]|uniref:Uncharacterized protein n=1 Tax=Gordonia phage Sombrero TaxID=2502420 RepID=A0A411BQZ7_9CAUD|nr:hypothetical protein HWC02_gp060 [Gordonia phage Sombrero]QAY04032.1 hypothetical protein SEA_SOMBRERO_73 [Gordonia phage Sombrero]